MSSSDLPAAVPVGSRRDLVEFIRFPRHLYRGSAHYVPHLEIERKGFFNPRKNPFYSHAEVGLFLLRSRSGKVLGRISAHIDRHFNDIHGEGIGFFGFFDSVDDPRCATLLFDAAKGFLRDRGMKNVLGPMNFTTNDEVGLLVEGFEGLPFLMMPYNYDYYRPLIEKNGFEKAKDLYAYYLRYKGETPEFVRKMSSRVKKSTRISVRTMDMKNFNSELDLVKTIYNDAWEKNWGFVPLTDAQIDHLAADLKPLVNPSIIYFAFVDGEPAGFFMALPDYNMLFREMDGRLLPFGIFRLLLGKKKINRLRVLTMGVARKFRRLGVEMIMLDEIYRRGPQEGFSAGELSWILEDNTVMNRIATRLCGEPYRTYRIYRQSL
jgi:GNAT superfamily N-acetyltransferase